MHKPCRSILAAVLLILLLPDIADFDTFGEEAIPMTLKAFIEDSAVQSVYQECSHNNWPIVARLGTVREPSIQKPNKPVLFLFVKNQTLDIHLEYFRTPPGRYVVLIYFPAGVVDKALSDFIKK
jgi:hypothetical protein